MSLKDFEPPNGGGAGVLHEYIKDNHSAVEDIVLDSDSLMILPSSKEEAGKLYNLAVGEADKDEETFAIADEVDWVKIEGRWWLSLWWD